MLTLLHAWQGCAVFIMLPTGVNVPPVMLLAYHFLTVRSLNPRMTDVRTVFVIPPGQQLLHVCMHRRQPRRSLSLLSLSHPPLQASAVLPTADLCLYPADKWKQQGWDFCDSVDPARELDGWAWSDVPFPESGEEGWPRLMLENRIYCSRVFRKLHVEVGFRQDGLQVG